MAAPCGRRFPSWRPCRGPIPFLTVLFIWAKALVPLAGDGVVPSSRSFLKASPGVPEARWALRGACEVFGGGNVCGDLSILPLIFILW